MKEVSTNPDLYCQRCSGSV